MNIDEQIKRKETINLKQTKFQFCYKEFKFFRKEISDPNCPFGFEKWEKEKCPHCRFYAEKIIQEEEIK